MPNQTPVHLQEPLCTMHFTLCTMFCRNRNTEQALAKEHMGINPAANISFPLITPKTADSKFKPMIPWTGIKCSNPPAARPGKSLGQYLT